MSTFAPGVNPWIIVMARPPWAKTCVKACVKTGATASAERPVSATRRVKLVVMVIPLDQKHFSGTGFPEKMRPLKKPHHAGAVSTL
jgi:hypothetical protein